MEILYFNATWPICKLKFVYLHYLIRFITPKSLLGYYKHEQRFIQFIIMKKCSVFKNDFLLSSTVLAMATAAFYTTVMSIYVPGDSIWAGYVLSLNM